MGVVLEVTCNIISIIVNACSILANAFGIYLLQSSKVGQSNQLSIITSLSCGDILLSLGYMVFLLMSLSGILVYESQAGHVVFLIIELLFHPRHATLVLLTLDRFLACNFTFKYRSICGRNTMRNVLIATWIVTLSPASIYCFVDFGKIYSVYRDYIYPTMDSIFITIFIVTYGSIYYRKRRSNLQFRQRNANDDYQFIKVTLAILVSFILFSVIPNLTLRFLPADVVYDIVAIYDLTFSMNMLSDPLIYVFFQKKVRDFAIAKIRRFGTRLPQASGEYDLETVGTSSSSVSKTSFICNNEL